MIFSPLVKALGGLCLVLVLLSSYLAVRLNHVKGDRDSAQSGLALCASVNESQVDQLHKLAREHGALVSKIAADTAAAEVAAARYLTLEAQYDSLNTENEALRDQLGRDNPETGRWLAAGMDHRVACSLWSGPACKN